MIAKPVSGEFYDGVVADYYDLLVPEDEYGSFSFFEDAIRDGGEPALELGCGTGRPIVSYRQGGLDVEGLDSSTDMLEQCRRKAREHGVDVQLHHARMESFSLERRFRTIFVVSSSFMILRDDETARRALGAIYRHLLPGGRVLIPLHIPQLAPGQVVGGDWFPNREAATRDDGSVVCCLGRLARFDEREQIIETTNRYQCSRDGRVEHEEDRSFVLHWHTQPQFRTMLEAAGFGDVRAVRGDWQPSAPDDPVFIFVGRRNDGS